MGPPESFCRTGRALPDDVGSTRPMVEITENKAMKGRIGKHPAEQL